MNRIKFCFVKLKKTFTDNIFFDVAEDADGTELAENESKKIPFCENQCICFKIVFFT